MKMYILGSCDIGVLCSSMRIEAKYAIYDIELRNHDFETQVDRHEERSKVDEVIDKSAWVNEFIPGLCHIRYLCSNMRMDGNNASYDMELKTQYSEPQVATHYEKSKVEDVVDKSAWVNENV